MGQGIDSPSPPLGARFSFRVSLRFGRASAARIKELAVEAEKERAGGECKISEVLWVASNLFQTAAAKEAMFFLTPS